MTNASATERTTHRILDAALAEFIDYGLRRTGMEDVARRAGVARATVYRKFAVKDALVQAVILREGDRFMAEFDTVIRPYGSFADQLVHGWVFTVRYVRGHRLFNSLLNADPEAMLPYLTIGNGEMLASGRAFFVRFIRAAQERGEVPDYDPEPVAELMVRIALSYAISPGGCLDLTDESQTAEFARRHLVPAIYGPQ